jgi:molybdate transport system permease protein
MALFLGLIVSVFWAVTAETAEGTCLKALIDPAARHALRVSVQTSLTAMVFTGCIGLPTAWILGRKRFWGKAVVEALIDVPLVLPPLVSGLGLLLLLGRAGPAGKAIESLGMQVAFTKAGVIVAQCFVATPLFVRTVRERFASLPEDYFSTATTLKASSAFTFFTVALPLSRSSIVTGLLMAWCRALGEFGASSMLAGAIPLKTETVPMAIYGSVAAGDMETAGALSFLFLVLALGALTAFRVRKRRYRGA